MKLLPDFDADVLCLHCHRRCVIAQQGWRKWVSTPLFCPFCGKAINAYDVADFEEAGYELVKS